MGSHPVSDPSPTTWGSGSFIPDWGLGPRQWVWLHMPARTLPIGSMAKLFLWFLLVIHLDSGSGFFWFQGLTNLWSLWRVYRDLSLQCETKENLALVVIFSVYVSACPYQVQINKRFMPPVKRTAFWSGPGSFVIRCLCLMQGCNFRTEVIRSLHAPMIMNLIWKGFASHCTSV